MAAMYPFFLGESTSPAGQLCRVGVVGLGLAGINTLPRIFLARSSLVARLGARVCRFLLLRPDGGESLAKLNALGLEDFRHGRGSNK